MCATYTSQRTGAKDAKDLIEELEAAGWFWHSTTGSHRHCEHPTKTAKVAVPYPRKDMHPRTVKSIKRAARIEGSPPNFASSHSATLIRLRNYLRCPATSL